MIYQVHVELADPGTHALLQLDAFFSLQDGEVTEVDEGHPHPLVLQLLCDLDVVLVDHDHLGNVQLVEADWLHELDCSEAIGHLDVLNIF